MSNSLKKIYESHHATARSDGFSIMKSSRGELFSRTIGSGKKVLDLGCRDGGLTSFYSKGNKVLGVDIDEVSLTRAKNRLGIETASFDLQSEWETLSGRLFDAAVAGELLEHVYYPEKVTEKVSLHLDGEGAFVGSVPNAFSLKNRLRYLFAVKKNTPLSDPTHINHFSARELERMLGRYFSEVEVIGMGRYGFLARALPQWFAFDLCFIARKPIIKTT